YAGTNDTDGDLWAGELRLNGKLDLFGREANLTLGAERNHLEDTRRGTFASVGVANIYADNFEDFPPPAGQPIPYGNAQDYDGAGVYAQLQARPWERLSILLGGRYDWADTTSIEDINDPNPLASDKEDEEFTWRAGSTLEIT